MKSENTPVKSHRSIKALAIAACTLLAAGALIWLGCSALTSSTSANDSLLGAPLGDSASASGGSSSATASAAESYYAPEPYTPFNTEEYAYLDEPGFTSVAAQPLSTLSADVDTASYCNLRRMVTDGATCDMVPAGAIRTEEMLNYFDYDYAAPTDDNLFSVTARAGVCPWNPETLLLVMGFSTEAREAADPQGTNLVFLIDTSGSMDSYDKLPLLQEALGKLVEQLDERDRVSIVTYSGDESIVLEGASGADQHAIMHTVYGLVAYGSTNGEAGLATAYEVAERNFIEGGVNRIVMASDGDLNVGITSESDLHDFVEQKRESGVYLSVLGFGSGNYKDTKMEVLADHGNGTYHYIDCLEEAERVFGEDLRSNFVPLADDVKVQVEFNPACMKGYRLIGYENRTLAAEEFEDDTVDAGEVGAGHQFTVAYEIVPVGSSFEMYDPDLKYERLDEGVDGEAAQPSESRSGESGESSAQSWRNAEGTEPSGSESDASSSRTENDTPAENATRDSSLDATSIPTGEWLTCSVRYKPAGQGESVEEQAVVDASAFSDDPGNDWRFAASVIECSMILRDSDYAESSTFDSALELAQESATGTFAEERQGFIDLMNRLNSYAARAPYSNYLSE